MAFAQVKKDVHYTSKLQKKAYLSAQKFIGTAKSKMDLYFSGRGRLKIDTLIIDEKGRAIHLYLNRFLAEAPLRNEMVQNLKTAFSLQLPASLKKYDINIYSENIELNNYIPNIYRNNIVETDKSRMPQTNNIRPIRKNLVNPLKPFQITNGLNNSNIALWGSHGYYYESSLDRWAWQRARLFTTVEDLGPTSFVLPFLIPMLNNSGAFVMTPRERDTQTYEVIIDNDVANKFTKYPDFLEQTKPNTAFAYSGNIAENENPFRKGTYLFGKAAAKDSIVWVPDFPESGNYMVYIAYGYVKEASELKYRIYYDGGYQEYLVDQKIGHGTWIPLGNHYFKKGVGQTSGKVVLYIEKGQTLSIDAIRFGGGMGKASQAGGVAGYGG